MIESTGHNPLAWDLLGVARPARPPSNPRGARLRNFRVLRLDTFRSKILVFALTVALIPSGLTAWISYTQNRRALEDKITQELLSSSGQAAREMDVWLRERLYDLRVFASSYEVSEKLARRRAGTAPERL